MSVLFGSTTVLDGVAISPPEGVLTGANSVGSYQPYTAGFPPFRNYEYFTGDADEALIIRSGAGSASIATGCGVVPGATDPLPPAFELEQR